MTHRPFSRRKLRQTSVLLLLATALPLSSCGRVDFTQAIGATERINTELSEAQKIINRLKLAGLVTGEELGRLDVSLTAAKDATKALDEKLRSVREDRGPNANANGEALPRLFGEMTDKIETFKLSVSSLGNAKAKESYQSVVSLLGADVETVAAALGCERTKANCVRCSDGQLHCKT